MQKIAHLIICLFIGILACKPDIPEPPIEEPKDYVINYFDFLFAPNSKVYLDSSLHIHSVFPAWALTTLRKGLYDVTIEGYGQRGPDGWPILGISTDSLEEFESLAVFDTSLITNQIVRLDLKKDSSLIYLFLTNDSYDKVTKADCNVFIKKLTFKPVLTKTVRLVWNKNSEPDVAGYKVYQRQRFFNSTNDTTIFLNLEKGLLYKLSVTAYDKSGNESDFSEEIEVNIN